MHALTYTLFDPAPCDFPAPRVPLLPSLGAAAPQPGDEQHGFELVGHGRKRRLYVRGRYALYEAYRLSGVGPQGALLAPAYHCRTMLDPAISLGAPVTLYPLQARLAPDLDALRRLIAAPGVRPRALLLTHYFGFPQDAAPIRQLCEEHGVALIEDCSHALFNQRSAPRLGQHGRYTVASPYKLLPCEQGGLLIAAEGADFGTQGAPRRPGLGTELRTVANALSRWRQGRLQRVGEDDIAALPDQLARILAAPAVPGIERRSEQAHTSALYLAQEEGQAGALCSRMLIRLNSLDHAVSARRRNYLAWERATRELPHCKPLFPALPDDCVPYMFPLLLDRPQQHFYALKKLGMPIWRWDDMAQSPCPVAQRYRQHLLHLPCHQSLSDAEMRWMISAVALVLGHGALEPASHSPLTTT